MKHSADVIIVGGGIIGCAAAYYLAKRGVSVLVLEGSSYIGNGVPPETAAVSASPDVTPENSL